MALFKGKPINLLAIGGHIASGKTTFTRRIKDKLQAEGILCDPIRNYKLRKLRYGEIDGVDYRRIGTKEEWDRLINSREIVATFDRAGIQYGFPRDLFEALRENKAHQIVNLDIGGLATLNDFFKNNEKYKKPIVSIGLYCTPEEGRNRIEERVGTKNSKDITSEQIAEVARQMNTLHMQTDAYKSHYGWFRYLFHNHSPIDTADILAERAIDLIKKGEKYHELGNQEFRQRYVDDI